MNRYLFVIILFLGPLAACKKDKKLNTTPVTVDSIVVHRLWGFVPYGYGHRTFMVTNDRLLEDTSHRITDTTSYLFNKQLPDTKFNLAKDLRTAVPAFMLQAPKGVVYGDLHTYADGTAMYLIIYKGGTKHTCIISDVLGTVPPDVRPFAEKVQKAYDDLQS